MNRPTVAIAAITLAMLVGGESASGASPSPDAPSAPSTAASEQSVETLALVPVVGFWSGRDSLSLDEVRSAVAGSHPRFDEVLVASSDAEALAETLGVIAAPSTRTVAIEAIEAAVAGSRRTLGLIPAGSVRPSVRALGVDGRSLFGGRRIRSLDEWPLTIPNFDPDVPGTFEPSTVWTLAAAGDVMLDREVYRQSVLLDKGPGHPWGGGWARITSRTCCTADGGNAITAKRVGGGGEVRRLFRSADIALVNHEGPAPDDFSYHPEGFVFTFDPALEEGLSGAGIDVVSLANNHIRNAGSRGVVETIRNVRAAGIATVGAGRDLASARRGHCTDAGGVRVCFLAYDDVNTQANGASAGRPGAASLGMKSAASDIRRLRREGADVIVVVPHWGREYVAAPTSRQTRQAARLARAGADAVLGSHSHVAGAMELVGDVPVFYSLGNLIFDLPRFEQTEEGVIVELSFVADRLAQVRIHPTVFVGRSQVNLLDPGADGRVVLKRMQRASAALRGG